MQQLPAAARTYVAGVILVGLVVFLAALPHARFDQPLLFAGLLILSTASTALKITLPLTASGSTMSVSYAVDFAALLLIGPHDTMLIAATSALSQCIFKQRERNPPYRTLFSVAALIITVEGAGLAALALGGIASTMPLQTMARPLVGVATAYFLLNTGLVAAAIALSTRQPVFATWQNNFIWSAPSYFVGAGSAALATSSMETAGYWIAPLMYAPIYLTYRTYKMYMARIDDEHRHLQETSETANLHLATIEALAGAIDAKDRTTHMHIRRVRFYAAKLAKAAGLSDPEIQGVKTAALLHDIGKLAVPDHILTKPGPLTQEEFQRIRIHPQVGAEIITSVPFPYPVAPLILSHHERWDGKGYPQGLAGEEIPIGARILTIVDYFDAVTSARPYHKALTPKDAIDLLQSESGLTLDPNLLAIFLNLLPELMEELEATRPQRERVTYPPSETASTTNGLVSAGSTDAFETIALAHREIYALYDIAQAMGTSLGVSDTMALISSKLAKIVPWSGCALFLHQPDGDSLKCRFATGIEASHLLNTSIKMGDEPAGWVARNKRTLINADPAMTFRAAGLGHTSLRSAMICPLHFNDMFIGSLALYHIEPRHYTDDHRRLVERVAEQAGAVLHNSMVFEQMQEDSLTDSLTGLPNRRSMFVHLASELARADRLKTEVAVIVIDVDGFKQINDSFGHNAGDDALRAVAKSLQTALRPYDLCVRYAGDEFIVVIAGCTHDVAEAKRKELQERIAEITLEVHNGESLRLSVSAGAAIFPGDGATYETLLATADHRMYRDKHARHGRPTVTRPTPAVNVRAFEPVAALRAAR